MAWPVPMAMLASDRIRRVPSPTPVSGFSSFELSPHRCARSRRRGQHFVPKSLFRRLPAIPPHFRVRLMLPYVLRDFSNFLGAVQAYAHAIADILIHVTVRPVLQPLA